MHIDWVTIVFVFILIWRVSGGANRRCRDIVHLLSKCRIFDQQDKIGILDDFGDGVFSFLPLMQTFCLVSLLILWVSLLNSAIDASILMRESVDFCHRRKHLVCESVLS